MADRLDEIRSNHRGRRWHDDGSLAGADSCDACALLDELVRLRGYLEPMTDCDVYDCRHTLDARRALRLDPEDDDE